jgi:phosphate transport system protein
MTVGREKFEHEMGLLHEDLVRMGDLATEMLSSSVKAFKHLDMELAAEVDSRKGELAELDQAIERRALEMITLYQPMAKDMRVLGTSLKLNTYLYRVGRYAKDIARDTRALEGHPHMTKVVVIPRMTEEVVGMVRDVLEAYKTEDLRLIANFAERDDEVDGMWDMVFRECLTYMMEDNRKITQGLHYIMVARALERCGDHACKMAEKVHYMVTGLHVEIK